MTVRHALATPRTQAAAILFGMSLLFATTALVGAVRIEPGPDLREEPSFSLAAPRVGAATASDLIDQAVAAAPFSVTREPPVPEAARESASIPDYAAQLELVGTVVDAEGGSFVLLSVARGAPKVVRVADTIAGHRLRSVGQATAVLSRISDGGRVELHVPRSR